MTGVRTAWTVGHATEVRAGAPGASEAPAEPPAAGVQRGCEHGRGSHQGHRDSVMQRSRCAADGAGGDDRSCSAETPAAAQPAREHEPAPASDDEPGQPGAGGRRHRADHGARERAAARQGHEHAVDGEASASRRTRAGARVPRRRRDEQRVAGDRHRHGQPHPAAGRRSRRGATAARVRADGAPAAAASTAISRATPGRARRRRRARPSPAAASSQPSRGSRSTSAGGQRPRQRPGRPGRRASARAGDPAAAAPAMAEPGGAARGPGGAGLDAGGGAGVGRQVGGGRCRRRGEGQGRRPGGHRSGDREQARGVVERGEAGGQAAAELGDRAPLPRAGTQREVDRAPELARQVAAAAAQRRQVGAEPARAGSGAPRTGLTPVSAS